MKGESGWEEKGWARMRRRCEGIRRAMELIRCELEDGQVKKNHDFRDK